MTTPRDIVWLADLTDGAEVGGKAWNLARTAAAGLPVPNAFVITADAYRSYAHRPDLPQEFRQRLEDAYARLGGEFVAVRSSALDEDGRETSFAGQMTTILGVRGLESLHRAIRTCWNSLDTERTRAYRQELLSTSAEGKASGEIAMAVVVQQLVPAEAAGVLFTQDPSRPDGMAIESSWGLGEAVVSGRITPDQFQVCRSTREIQSRRLGRKSIRITPLGEEPVPDDEQSRFSLTDDQLFKLAELGHAVEKYYGEPRDIEWAIAGGKVYLLQARPITAASSSREPIREEAIQTLKQLSDPRGTVWVRYNLSEILPEPTPMTWCIVQRLLAQDGGFGAMNRDLGAIPDESLGRQTGYDLILGRPMANLSRLPRLQFHRPPLEYPFAKFKANPHLALDPQPVLNPLRDGLGAILRLPGIIWRLWKMTSIPRRLVDNFAGEFTGRIVPPFAADARAALAEDWSNRNAQELFTKLTTWTERTLVDFARHSLKPTVLAKLCWDALVELLRPKLGAEGATMAVSGLSLGAAPPPEAHLALAIRNLASGKLTREEFLAGFGHRCRNEMELAQPRWSEDTAAVDQLIQSGTSHTADERHTGDSPEEVFRVLASPLRVQAYRWLDRMRTYMGLREAAKHELMRGYAVIRKAIVHLGRTTGLHDDIFHLSMEEILKPESYGQIAERKRNRRMALSIDLPAVIFSDDLEAIGRPAPPPDGAKSLQGIPVSGGVAEAPALVLSDPAPAPDSPFVLVCTSTDPAWVPLFAKARAVIMETGGVLSHGAIVAREFCLPAVAGLPDACRTFTAGQVLRVDGNTGTVTVLS